MLAEVKTLLGVEGAEQDTQLKAIIDIVEKRLLSLCGVDTVPGELNYIVTEVAVIRYNRIGNEGMKSYSQEGESISYSNNDFEAFMAEIEEWKKQQENSKLGKVRFL